MAGVLHILGLDVPVYHVRITFLNHIIPKPIYFVLKNAVCCQCLSPSNLMFYRIFLVINVNTTDIVYKRLIVKSVY